MPLFLYPFLALGGFVAWAWKRGSNSAQADMPDSVTASCDGRIIDALGWPYFFGKGDPSTPWSDGPKGVDCSGSAQMALVRLGELSSSAGDRGASSLANDSNPIPVGSQGVGDLAYYPGHVMVVCGPPGPDGHSPVIGASGGHAYTLGTDPNARVKLYSTGKYRSDFVTYMRLKS